MALTTFKGRTVINLNNAVSKSIPCCKNRNIIEGNTNMIKREIIIKGVNCPDCLGKIEGKISNLDGISKAVMNVIDKVLTIYIEDIADIEDIVKKVIGYIPKIENGAVGYEKRNNGSEESDEKEQQERRKEKRKLVAVLVGVLFFVLALVVSQPSAVQVVFYYIAFLCIGFDIVLKAVRNIGNGRAFDENFLMSIATIGALCIGEYWEAVAVILLYKIGQYLEDKAVNKSRRSIKALMDIKPDYANLKLNGDIKKVSPDEVSIGDYIVVKPGERVPLDGKVIDGSSSVDTKAITGEPVPRNIKIGDSIYSGFINGSGLLTIEVEKSFSESTVFRILELVQNAGSKKSKTENFFTKFARVYTPVVVFAAVAIAVFPPLIIPGAYFSEWIYRALIFLVISCPCALVISIPLTFFGGIGAASRKGILIKGSNYIEALNKVNCVVFDKTGTLTKGVFKVTDIIVKNGYSKEELLGYAAVAESYSNHPIAISIRDAFKGPLDSDKLQEYNELPGMGVSGEIEGKLFLCGNRKLLEKFNINFEKATETGTIVYLSIDSEYAGYLVISDEIKDDAKFAIKALKELGVERTVLLSGDNVATAEAVAKELSIDEVHAGLMPGQKVEELEKIEKEVSDEGKVIFVGDGINDAPVITRADIGVAMGGLGADAAIESADIVLMNDEPLKLAEAISIAMKTKRIVYQNIYFALSVKLFFLLFAVFGYAAMWEAIIADVGVLLLVVFNSTRILICKDN